ncbi:MAG: hypothetical protein JW787_12855 [Sedimentisphaerales bacterium]|nr:hypothetical protein [Sedimentisphaerales bacterium]
MKSEHRHELKTNELAAWLNNFPQWCKENIGTIIIVAAAIVVVAGYFGWKSISQNVQSGEHEEFTAMVDRLVNAKAEIAMASQSSDMSFDMLIQAKEMEKFAARTGNNNIGALALVQAADAIRTELLFRPSTISKEDLEEKINEAKTLYAQAIEKSTKNSTVMALATLGLGLCAEELGNFDEAKKIYTDIVTNPVYDGTAAVSKADLRLNTMDNYKQDIVFLPAPPPPAPDPNTDFDPLIQQLRNASRKPADSNVPSDINIPSKADIEQGKTDVNLPVSVNLPGEANLPVDEN